MSGLKRVEAKKCSEETMEASLSEQDDKKPAVGEQTKDKKCDSNTDRSIKNDKNTKVKSMQQKAEFAFGSLVWPSRCVNEKSP